METTRIVIGCNYHTKWQRHPGMRFVLVEISGNKARLQTRSSRKDFWTNISDLVFIESEYNKRKSAHLESNEAYNSGLAEKILKSLPIKC